MIATKNPFADFLESVFAPKLALDKSSAALAAQVKSAQDTLTKTALAQQAQIPKAQLLADATSNTYDKAAQYGKVLAENDQFASEQTRKNVLSYGSLALIVAVVLFFGWKKLKKL